MTPSFLDDLWLLMARIRYIVIHKSVEIIKIKFFFKEITFIWILVFHNICEQQNSRKSKYDKNGKWMNSSYNIVPSQSCLWSSKRASTFSVRVLIFSKTCSWKFDNSAEQTWAIKKSAKNAWSLIFLIAWHLLTEYLFYVKLLAF